ESRHILNYLPFIAFLLVQTFSNSLRPSFVIGCSILSFLFSKAWISLYTFPGPSWPENYNVNFGCYLTDMAYALQFALFVLTGTVFYFFLKKQQNSLPAQ